MSKSNKFLTFLSVLTLMLVISSCVEGDDYEIPTLNVQEPDITSFGTLTTFSAVIARYETAVIDGDQVGVFDTENDAPIYIEGYVVSSDASGNFYEEIVVQNSKDGDDAGADPRRGLNVQINVSSLSDTYEIGRKVYIKLNGLAIGVENGVFTLGRANGGNLEQLQAFEYQSFIKRGIEVATIIPKVVAIGDLTEADENTFVQFDNMQINRTQTGLTYAGESSDEFDGFRTLENCDTNATISLQTSTFADFKQIPVPQQKGSIQGIYSRDFGDDFSVLILNSTSDVSFTSPDRCDPQTLDCDGPLGGTGIVFEEDFEGTSESALTSDGWININANGGTYQYSLRNFGGNSYMQASAFNSNDNPFEAWLITPAIDLENSTNEELTFTSNAGFYNGAALSVLVSTDFTGNAAEISSATWIEVEATFPQGPSSGYGSSFTDSGSINISCLEGDVYVAFKYSGSDNGITTTFQVDDVLVTGNL